MRKIHTYFGGLLAGLAAFVPTLAPAQRHVTMDEVVAVATDKNANVRIAELERRISNARYRETDAVLLPQVSVGYNAMVTNNPLNAFGFLLQQGVATQRDFDPARLNHPGATHNFGTSAEVQMPLLNLDMLYARKGARLQQEVYRHRQTFTKAHVAFEAKKAYAQLQFAYAMRDILRSTLADVRQIHRSVSSFYEQGLLQQSDVLNAEVQVNTIESALSKAESNIDNASDGLNLLMGNRETAEGAYVVDSLRQATATPLGNAVTDTRADVRAMEAAVEASKVMVKSARMGLLPKLNGFGSYTLNDSKAFGFRKGSYLVGLSLSWNVFSGNRQQSKIKAARHTADKMEEELQALKDKNRLELSKTLRDLHDGRLEIKKRHTSVRQAEEALRILNDRHREGLASTTDCLMAQAQLSQQRMAMAQAVLSYNITTYYIEFLTQEP